MTFGIRGWAARAVCSQGGTYSVRMHVVALPSAVAFHAASLCCSPTARFLPPQGQKLSLGTSITTTLVSSVGKWLDRGLTAVLGGGETGTLGISGGRGARLGRGGWGGVRHSFLTGSPRIAPPS